MIFSSRRILSSWRGLLKFILTSKRAFTLLEIIVVMGIGLLMAGGIGLGLKGMMGSKSLTTGSSMVVDMAGLARQNAISKNRMTALMIAEERESSRTLLGIYELEDPENKEPPTSDQWKQVHKWEKMPLDLRVERCTWSSSEESPPVDFPNLYYHKKALGEYHYIVFMPEGRLGQSETPELLLVKSDYKKKTEPTQREPYQAQIYILSETGRAKVDFNY